MVLTLLQRRETDMRGNLRMLCLLAVLTMAGAPALQAQREPQREAPAGAAPRGWLGFGYHSPAEGRVGTGARVVVDAVIPGSPAQRAGLQRGDTLVRWNRRTDVAAAMR